MTTIAEGINNVTECINNVTEGVTNEYIPTIEKFKKLGKYNEETGETILLCVFDEVNAELKTNNGGGWLRKETAFAKTHRVLTIKENGTLSNLNKNCTEEDLEYYELNIKPNLILGKGPSIKYYKVFGKCVADATTRYIRPDIRAYYKNKPCVSCGTNSNIEIDHKNGLYNNPRINNVSTQTIEDFQPLCKHCNDVKRQTYVWQNKNNKRHPATLIPKYAHFGVDYVEGDASYDSNDPNAMVGTYWYDPVEFHKKMHQHTSIQLQLLQ